MAVYVIASLTAADRPISYPRLRTRRVVRKGIGLYRLCSCQDALTFAHDSLLPSVPERDSQDL